ncbi:trypsin-like peptidase domain-containing protein [Azospirillum rugosum]|uniref:Serine protease n=1 Tax=Azospirillum rugosum TaxID=416170 RepID=A0ABS4SX75_9PROT|nr:trypsin-like peptidase domain-containing protein [Azospirillum rugosum]MBP2297163.1 V8-like Glu-specific endopeptidase [Azospirillum rugosum]MDQ0528458.1 V8-like Glu-specific endopeptidase [Azospirillum rugosum]
MTNSIDDDKYPARAVVYIEATWGKVTYTGSGFLVGRNDVITASHVVYNASLGGKPSSIKIYPSYNPGKSDNKHYGVAKAQFFTNFDPDSDGKLISGDFYRNTQAGSEIDAALLTLSDPIGDTYGYFGIDWNYAGGSVGVLGYPAKYGRYETYDSGSVRKSSVDSVYYVNADLEINPGNSGGPIFYDNGSGPFAIGIVSTAIAAPSLGGQASWLKTAITANDSFINASVPTQANGRTALVTDTVSSREVQMDLYVGSVTMIKNQYIGSKSHESVSGTDNGDFMNLVDGNDAADGKGGDDVLDGGLGSNFLTGGAGTDTFFVDGRGGGVTWSTITDFEPNEWATAWGWRPGVSTISWEAMKGASGYEGATAHIDFDRNGTIDASITFTGKAVGSIITMPGQIGSDSYLAFRLA